MLNDNTLTQLEIRVWVLWTEEHLYTWITRSFILLELKTSSSSRLVGTVELFTDGFPFYCCASSPLEGTTRFLDIFLIIHPNISWKQSLRLVLVFVDSVELVAFASSSVSALSKAIFSISNPFFCEIDLFAHLSQPFVWTAIQLYPEWEKEK